MRQITSTTSVIAKHIWCYDLALNENIQTASNAEQYVGGLYQHLLQYCMHIIDKEARAQYRQVEILYTVLGHYLQGQEELKSKPDRMTPQKFKFNLLQYYGCNESRPADVLA
jgi:hypothetical protein